MGGSRTAQLGSGGRRSLVSVEMAGDGRAIGQDGGGRILLLAYIADVVLTENAHPFKDPPLRMTFPFGLFGLTS